MNDTAAARFARAEGCLLGQLAGDSLGSLVEFRSAGDILAQYPDGVRRLANGGTWDTLAGQPTDDSEMALALARTLAAHGRYDSGKARAAYVDWLDSGPFDLGATVSRGLRGRPNPRSQANGALMRIAPLGIFGAGRDPAQTAAWARADAALTHPHPVCRQANALFAMAIALAVETGIDSRALYERVLRWAGEMAVEKPLRDAAAGAADSPPGDYLRQQGWVTIAFRNALWQLMHASSFEEGVVDTVMRGGDTDTNAAICGALLGAVHGREAVPAQWEKAVLACRPAAGAPGVRRPRPKRFWPVDALELAAALLAPASTNGQGAAGGETGGLVTGAAAGVWCVNALRRFRHTDGGTCPRQARGSGMTIDLRRAAPAIAAGMLGACSLSGDGLWRGDVEQWAAAVPPGIPAVTAATPVAAPVVEPPPFPVAAVVAPARQAPRAVAAAPRIAAPPAPAADVSPGSVMAGAPSTFLRLQAEALAHELSGLSGLVDSQRVELEGLAGGAAESLALYAAAVEALDERLRTGAAPDDPILVSQWESAKTALKAVADAYSARLRELGARIAVNRGMTAYLSESTRAVKTVHAALGVDSGAIAGVETGVAEVMGENDRLLTEIDGTFARYAAYLDSERDRLAASPPAGAAPAAVARADTGASAAMAPPMPEAMPAAAPETAMAPPLPAAAVPEPAMPGRAVQDTLAVLGPALITIRFDRAGVIYEDALYDAVGAALARWPGAHFELVALAPVADDRGVAARHAETARRNAERVMDSLIAMNLPPDRLQLAVVTSPAVRAGEVRLFVR